MTATTEHLTCEEIHTGFDALIERVADLALERDRAIAGTADLLEANSTLQQGLERARHEVHVRGLVEKSLREEIGDRNRTITRLIARLNEIATRCDNLEQRLDQTQQSARQEPRAVRTSWWSKRIGNRL